MSNASIKLVFLIGSFLLTGCFLFMPQHIEDKVYDFLIRSFNPVYVPLPAAGILSLSYIEFIESVQDDQVDRLMIDSERGYAKVGMNDGRRAELNLASEKN